MSRHAEEIARGQRFSFGANWENFIQHLSDQRITRAEASLCAMLGTESLKGKRFLDIGSGSGLFSLAARRLGARVHSFDYDPQSVECTRILRERFYRGDPDWVVEPGSILDEAFVRSLGQFDVVYSWGVLHHTGAMWRAVDNATLPVRPGGFLFIALYNDQGIWSRRWLRIKRLYNRLPRILKVPYAACFIAMFEIRHIVSALVRFDPVNYVHSWTRYSDTSLRGMSKWHDLIDWIGGYPFEVAKPEEVFDFLRRKGWDLEKFHTFAGKVGPNEFVFRARVRP